MQLCFALLCFWKKRSKSKVCFALLCFALGFASKVRPLPYCPSMTNASLTSLASHKAKLVRKFVQHAPSLVHVKRAICMYICHGVPEVDSTWYRVKRRIRHDTPPTPVSTLVSKVVRERHTHARSRTHLPPATLFPKIKTIESLHRHILIIPPKFDPSHKYIPSVSTDAQRNRQPISQHYHQVRTTDHDLK